MLDIIVTARTDSNQFALLVKHLVSSQPATRLARCQALSGFSPYLFLRIPSEEMAARDSIHAQNVNRNTSVSLKSKPLQSISVHTIAVLQNSYIKLDQWTSSAKYRSFKDYINRVTISSTLSNTVNITVQFIVTINQWSVLFHRLLW